MRRDRTNVQAIGRPSHADSSGAARNRYARLMQVAVRHEYYDNYDGVCADFTAEPTPPTAHLMADLGLLLQRDSDGFSVLYRPSRAEALFAYLRRNGDPEYWTRLSFVLSLDNPYFLNFTAMPLDMAPARSNFYFSNREAHPALPDRILLNPGTVVDFKQALPVAGPEIRVPTPPGVEAVVLIDIAGQPVMTVPRCVPESSPPDKRVCRDFVYLDLAELPQDKYRIETVETSVGTSNRRHEILYTLRRPDPLCFIDLLFSRPTPEATGIYPVHDLHPASDTRIIPVCYELQFAARSTFWRYFIVPQPPLVEIDELSIETVGPVPPVPFSGPDPVELIDGASAYRFVSDEPLRLQERSHHWFRLKGRPRRAAVVDDVLMSRLPVAGSEQILPQPADTPPRPVYSDIYVYV